MIRIIWQFRVPPETQPAFERVYGAEGDWAQLFSRGEGYGGTTLLRDTEDHLRYLAVDLWESLETFAAFKERFAAEYEALDRACEPLSIEERRIGSFGPVTVAV